MEPDLETYLKQKGIWRRVVWKSETIHTADAARTAGLGLHRVTKNLVSETDEGEYVLLIVPGDRRVSLRAAARALGVKNVRLLPLDKAEEVSGYPPGDTPSVVHKTEMRVVMDKSLLEHGTIYCGGGSRDKLLELKTEDVVKINRAIIAEISS